MVINCIDPKLKRIPESEIHYRYEKDMRNDICMCNMGNATMRYCGKRVYCTKDDIKEVICKLDVKDTEKRLLYMYFVCHVPECRLPLNVNHHPMYFPRLIRYAAKAMVDSWDFERDELKADGLFYIEEADELDGHTRNVLLRNGYKTFDEVVRADPEDIIALPKLGYEGYTYLLNYLHEMGLGHRLPKLNKQFFVKKWKQNRK